MNRSKNLYDVANTKFYVEKQVPPIAHDCERATRKSAFSFHIYDLLYQIRDLISVQEHK